MKVTLLAAVATLLIATAPPIVHADVIHGEAVFEVEYYGYQGEFDPPLLGPGSFVIRSHPYQFDPDDPYANPPPFEFDVLDFSFSFNGGTWDESDVPVCYYCAFTPEGDPESISFRFSDDEVSWELDWNFGDGNFGFFFDDGELHASGSAEDGEAGGGGDFTFARTVPEPGSAGLLLLGIVSLALGGRRRRGVVPRPCGP
jgi:hypothetical protein